MTRETLIAAWTDISGYIGHAPSSERYCAVYTVYSADYYGNGHKRYMRCEPVFAYYMEPRPRAVYGGSNDGDESRIQARMNAAGVRDLATWQVND